MAARNNYAFERNQRAKAKAAKRAAKRAAKAGSRAATTPGTAADRAPGEDESTAQSAVEEMDTAADR